MKDQNTKLLYIKLLRKYLNPSGPLTISTNPQVMQNWANKVRQLNGIEAEKGIFNSNLTNKK